MIFDFNNKNGAIAGYKSGFAELAKALTYPLNQLVNFL